MVRSLGFRKKLGFIYKRIKRPEDPIDPDELDHWEQCNCAVTTWIVNSLSKEIAASLVHIDDAADAWEDLEAWFGGSNGPAVLTIHEEIYNLKQGHQSIASYYNELITPWGEEDAPIATI